MKYIIGEKIGMTQIYDDSGRVYPATVVKVGEMTVTQIKNPEKDGYSAFQFGFGETKKAKAIKKPQLGHLKEAGLLKHLKEIRVQESEISQLKLGDKVGLDSFSVGDKVSISGISKSKGFQGVVKRHGFHGGPRSHGQKHSEREPGSIGGGGRAGGRVVKGMKMAGRMGGKRTTFKNLPILALNLKENFVILGGAVPGRRGTLVEIRG